MDAILAICLLVIVALIAFLGYLCVILALKFSAHSKAGDYRFVYRLRYRTVPCPTLSESRYWNRFPRDASASSHQFEYGGTVDDDVMRTMADMIADRVDGKSDAYKAGFILAMVQQNCTYRKDAVTFGKTEKYAFPVCTAYLRGCDCEDSAYWGACLSQLIGLDVAMFRVYGHMTYGVYLGGKGTCLEHDGKAYTICETTGFLPVGIYTQNKDIRASFKLSVPEEGWFDTETVTEDFAQYKK